MSDEQPVEQAPEILTPSTAPAPEAAPVEDAIAGTATPQVIAPSKPWYKRLRLIHYVIIFLFLAIVTSNIVSPRQYLVSAPIATPTPTTHPTVTPLPCVMPTVATAGAAATLRQPTHTASASARTWSHGNN